MTAMQVENNPFGGFSFEEQATQFKPISGGYGKLLKGVGKYKPILGGQFGSWKQLLTEFILFRFWLTSSLGLCG